MITLKKFGKIIYKLYYFIGMAAMALLAVNIIFAVIMRYCFSLNWKSLAEFNIVLFAFTTFWGMGLCVLKNEHVVIDILYDGLKPKIKRVISVLDYLIVLVVVLLFSYQSWGYTLMAGSQLSMGLEIPMYYMYGIMPVCGIICSICIIIKIIECIAADDSYFEPKNKVLTSENLPQKERKGA